MHVRDRDRPGQRRAVRAQRVQPRIRRPRRVRRLQRDEPHRHRRPHRISRPQRHAGQSRGHAARAALRPRRRRTRSVRRDAGPVRSGRRTGARKSSSLLGAGRDARRRRQLVQRFRGVASADAALEGVWHYWSRTLGVVYVETPDPAVNFLANGWLVYQTLACRMWARTGFYQSGGAFGFRDSCRTRWPWCMPSRACCASTCSALRPASSAKGTCSTGGIRPRAAACARTSPTITSGCRWPFAAMSRTTGDTGVLDERVPFLDVAPVATGRGSQLRPAASLRRRRHALRTLRPRDRPRPAIRRPRPAADGLRRLERRHESGRPARQRRKRLAGVLPVSTCSRSSPNSRGSAATSRFADRYTVEAGRLRGNIEAARLGRRVVSPRLFRRRHAAGLGRERGMPDRFASRKAGRSSPAPARTSARAWRWRASISASSAATPAYPAARSAVRQVGPQPRLHQRLRPRRARKRRPVHPRAIWTVDGLRRAWAIHERAWELFSLINPVTHADTPRTIATYRVEPTSWPPTSMRVAPHTGRGGWTWYTGSAGWMYRLIDRNRCWACIWRWTGCGSCRVFAGMVELQDHLSFLRQTVYRITCTKLPEGSADAAILSLDGQRLTEKTIPLVDDRREHIVEIKMGELQRQLAMSA